MSSIRSAIDDAPVPGAPWYRWLGPVMIGMAFVAMAAWTWRGWAEVQVDFGQQLYVPWAINRGQVLYRDLAIFHGPLSQYFNALLFRVFGTGMMTLAYANMAIMVGLLVLLWQLLRTIGGYWAVTGACVFFVLIDAFSLMGGGNYNFVCPYTHEITHGLALTVLGVWLMWRYGRGNGRAWLAGSGLALGLVFLTKAEVFLAAGLAMATQLALTLRMGQARRGEAVGRVGMFAFFAMLPAVVAFGLFCLAMPIADALLATLGPWPAVVQGRAAQMPIYQRLSGLDHPMSNLWLIVQMTALPAIVLGLGWLLAIKRGGRWRWVVAGMVALATVGGMVVTDAAFPQWAGWTKGRLIGSLFWYRIGQPLPVVLLALLVITVVSHCRRKMALTPQRILHFTLLLLSLALLQKLLLNTRLWHYGAFLAAPGALVVVVYLMGRIPQAIRRRGGRRGIFAVAAGGLLVGIVATMLLYNARFRNLRFDAGGQPYYLGRGADRLWGDNRCEFLGQAIAEIQERAQSGQTLLVLPEGVLLNYLLRMPCPIRVTNFMPPDLAAHGEDNIVAALDKHRPDYVVVAQRSLADHDPGLRTFGDNYAIHMARWVNDHYQLALQVGDSPVQMKFFGLWILVPKSTPIPGRQPASGAGTP